MCLKSMGLNQYRGVWKVTNSYEKVKNYCREIGGKFEDKKYINRGWENRYEGVIIMNETKKVKGIVDIDISPEEMKIWLTGKSEPVGPTTGAEFGTGATYYTDKLNAFSMRGKSINEINVSPKTGIGQKSMLHISLKGETSCVVKKFEIGGFMRESVNCD